MKKLKSNKMLLGIGITFLLLATIGISYAWFSATVKEVDVKDQVVTTGTLELTYTDGPEIKLVNARPGATLTKEIKVKNTGTLDAEYNLVWQVLKNEITNDEMVMSLTCQRLNKEGKEEEKCEGLDETPIKENIVLEARDIPSGYTHVYTVTVTFKELSKDQNYNQGKNFTGVLGVDEYNSPAAQYCTYDGDETTLSEWTKGIYKYTYDSSINGFKVVLADKTSTEPITAAPCTAINNTPIVSMAELFRGVKVKSIDLSSFDTSNVTDMNNMFLASSSSNWGTIIIQGLENLDTSKVVNMSGMFKNCYALSLDLSNFDTSNVTDMSSMFSGARANEIKGLDKFDTSNVTDMSSMFSGARATSIDVSNFNTSKVTKMGGMFWESKAEFLDLSSLDTSNVTDMNSMFYQCGAKQINISNWKTSNVTSVAKMFKEASATEIIGIENLDTSSVTNMWDMFNAVSMDSLDLSKWDTSSATSMQSMFANTKIAKIDVSSFDTSNVTNMYGMFQLCDAASLDLSSFDTSNVTVMGYMFYNSSSLKTIYVSNKFVTTKVTDGYQMFTGATSLVGSAGTTFDSSKIDKTYAHIDGGTANPGYFTLKTN